MIGLRFQPPAVPTPCLPMPQLRLDYEEDACFGGQLPVGAVCTFGRVMVPVVHTQPAPPAAGGGVLLYCWLPPEEARELAAAVAAQAKSVQ
jgi:hypothetical protein